MKQKYQYWLGFSILAISILTYAIAVIVNPAKFILVCFVTLSMILIVIGLVILGRAASK